MFLVAIDLDRDIRVSYCPFCGNVLVSDQSRHFLGIKRHIVALNSMLLTDCLPISPRFTHPTKPFVLKNLFDKDIAKNSHNHSSQIRSLFESFVEQIVKWVEGACMIALQSVVTDILCVSVEEKFYALPGYAWRVLFGVTFSI